MLTLNTNIMSLTTQNYLNITGSTMGVAAERVGAMPVSEPDAVVYTQAGFQGQSQVLKIGRYDTSDLTIPNDSISSVVVRKGVRVTLYEHGGFSGNQAVIDANTDALGAQIDGTTSSIVVEQI